MPILPTSGRINVCEIMTLDYDQALYEHVNESQYDHQFTTSVLSATQTFTQVYLDELTSPVTWSHSRDSATTLTFNVNIYNELVGTTTQQQITNTISKNTKYTDLIDDYILNERRFYVETRYLNNQANDGSYTGDANVFTGYLTRVEYANDEKLEYKLTFTDIKGILATIPLGATNDFTDDINTKNMKLNNKYYSMFNPSERITRPPVRLTSVIDTFGYDNMGITNYEGGLNDMRDPSDPYGYVRVGELTYDKLSPTLGFYNECLARCENQYDTPFIRVDIRYGNQKVSSGLRYDGYLTYNPSTQQRTSTTANIQVTREPKLWDLERYLIDTDFVVDILDPEYATDVIVSQSYDVVDTSTQAETDSYSSGDLTETYTMLTHNFEAIGSQHRVSRQALSKVNVYTPDTINVNLTDWNFEKYYDIQSQKAYDELQKTKDAYFKITIEPDQQLDGDIVTEMMVGDILRVFIQDIQRTRYFRIITSVTTLDNESWTSQHDHVCESINYADYIATMVSQNGVEHA